MIQTLFILNLILGFNLFAEESSSLYKMCKKMGGKVTSKGCYCWDLESYINPWSESCLITLVDQTALLSKNKSTCCHDTGVSLQSVSSDPYVPVGDLCASPSKYLCNDQINPFVLASQMSSIEMVGIRHEAENSPAVKQYINEVSAGKAHQCSDLKNPDWKFCHEMVEKIIREKLYTDERKKKASELFEKARSAMSAFLENQKKYFDKDKNRKELEAIDKMIATVKQTKLYFGLDLPGRSSEYNAFQLNQNPESQKRWYDGLGFSSDKASSVFLEGMILQIDTNPQGVYMVFLHELGHTFDGVSSEFRKDYHQSGHPFQKQMACFREKNSVGAKSADWACLETQASRVSVSEPEKAKKLAGIVETLKKNPDMQWVPIAQGLDDQCQMGQLGEAFAGWVASEAFALENRDTLLSVTSADEPVGLVDLKSRLTQMPQLAAVIADTCLSMIQNSSKTRDANFDSHPIDRDILDAFLLAHPLANKAIGCLPSSISGYNFTDSKPTNQSSSKRLYCGRDELNPQGVQR